MLIVFKKCTKSLIIRYILFYFWVIFGIIAKLFFDYFKEISILSIISGICGIIAIHLTIKQLNK